MSLPKFSDKDFYSCTTKVVGETLDKLKDKSPVKRASVVVNLNRKQSKAPSPSKKTLRLNSDIHDYIEESQIQEDDAEVKQGQNEAAKPKILAISPNNKEVSMIASCLFKKDLLSKSVNRGRNLKPLKSTQLRTLTQVNRDE